MESRTDAQQRANAIRVFREELARLEREGAFALDAKQREAVDAHHGRLLAGLGKSFDIDRTDAQARLSIGMRVASFLGALALSASVFFVFLQFWGLIPTPLQVTILIGSVLLTFGAALVVHGRDQTGYFTGLLAIIAMTCFVLDLGMLGSIFNITPSPNALLAWGVFAFILAYAFDLRLLLAAGIVCVGAWIAARTGMVAGRQWGAFIESPENFFLPAIVAFAVPFLRTHRRHALFPAVYRAVALVAVFIAILALGTDGRLSYMEVDRAWLESTYQWIGFLSSAGVVWLGVRRGWTECVNVGTAAFVVFLFVKFVDWWWETMPRYLFFFVIGLTAVLILLLLRRLRTAAADYGRVEAA